MPLRAFWFAIAFLGLLPPSSRGQYYWYYYGDLSVWAEGANAYTYAVVAYGWIHFSELKLERDGQTVDYRWGRSYYSGQPVQLWVSNSGCLPPYTLYLANGYVEGELSDYGSFFDWFFDNDVTPGPSVSVTSASIPNDNISVTLAPCGGYGPLTVQVEGNTTHSIFQGDRGGGSHGFSFNIPNLPNGQEFTQVRATWQPNGSSVYNTRQYRFRVLGDYNHTQYNTPDHNNNCSGPMEPFTYIDAQTCWAIDCQSAQTAGAQALREWLDEVIENGTGLHPTLGILWGEPQCTGRARYRRTGRTCPACLALGELVAFQDVAVAVGHLDLSCGNTVYVHEVGVRTVKDRGGRVGPQQLDHYIGITGCNQASNYGPKKTIKLY